MLPLVTEKHLPDALCYSVVSAVSIARTEKAIIFLFKGNGYQFGVPVPVCIVTDGGVVGILFVLLR